jgi:GntR family transcriptional regulator
MPAPLHIDPQDSRPIWSQIEEGLRRLIASGALVGGEPVPSVRDLARELQVNPATVSKAYQRLTDAEVLTVRRGEGTFVAERPPALSDRERRDALGGGADRYAGLALSLGASRKEAVEQLQDRWRDLLEERKENA